MRSVRILHRCLRQPWNFPKAVMALAATVVFYDLSAITKRGRIRE